MKCFIALSVTKNQMVFTVSFVFILKREEAMLTFLFSNKKPKHSLNTSFWLIGCLVNLVFGHPWWHERDNSFKMNVCRGWSPKFGSGLNITIGCSSKSIWVIKLSFCHNDPLMGESFWQNNSLVTHILFELQPIIIFSPVANFSDQSLVSQHRNYSISIAFFCFFKK